MNSPSFDRVVDALRQVTTESNRQSGQWTRFHCPVPTHGQGRGDRNPSLGVKYDPRREKTIVNCFSGCVQDDVLDAAGLHVRDLFDRLPDRARDDYRPSTAPRPQRSHGDAERGRRPVQRPTRSEDLGAVVGPRRHITTYTYRLPDLTPVGQVLRFATAHERGIAKDFSQRRWEKSRQRWVPGGFAPVLFEAQIVAEAINDGHPILLCEGEKDVQHAIIEGFPATCNAMGAGKFLPEHAAQLRGAATVVVVADRDRAGFLHAASVVEHLNGMVGDIDVRQAATGKDLSDHFHAGHGINDLVPVDKCQLAQLRRADLADRSRSGAGPRVMSGIRSVGVSGIGWPERDWGLDR
ncbi:MAG: hypothetical protein HOQ24_08670 [Mycobacteriaceae bacterium]|nr:hypothetical protein [Mycobacteriaceae bacterium]